MPALPHIPMKDHKRHIYVDGKKSYLFRFCFSSKVTTLDDISMTEMFDLLELLQLNDKKRKNKCKSTSLPNVLDCGSAAHSPDDQSSDDVQ